MKNTTTHSENNLNKNQLERPSIIHEIELRLEWFFKELTELERYEFKKI